jgi:hypothetical protein
LDFLVVMAVDSMLRRANRAQAGIQRLHDQALVGSERSRVGMWLGLPVWRKPDANTGTRSGEIHSINRPKCSEWLNVSQNIFSLARFHLFVHIHSMKRKLLKTRGKETATVAQPAAAGSAIDASPKGQGQWTVRTAGSDTITVLEFPPPDVLAEAARREVNRKALDEYSEAISVLRDEKGFSFREIAEWLTENGVEADYNAVYRVYTKGMSDDEEHDVALREAEEERDEVPR